MPGKGSTSEILTDEDVRHIIEQTCASLPVDHKRVLVIIPDGTRTAPIPLIFRVLYEQIGGRAAQLDYLIALGTHPPMSEEAIDHLVGMTGQERSRRYPNVRVFNHACNNPQALLTNRVNLSKERSSLPEVLVVNA